MIVLDASAAVAVLLNIGAGVTAIRERMDESDGGTHVPHVFEIEVSSALRHYALGNRLSRYRSAELLEDLASMRVTRYPHTALLQRVWELRQNVTAYDALAETLDAPLVTLDARLAQAPGIRAAVEVYG